MDEPTVTLTLSAAAHRQLVSFMELMAEGPGYLNRDGADEAAEVLAAIRAAAEVQP